MGERINIKMYSHTDLQFICVYLQYTAQNCENFRKT